MTIKGAMVAAAVAGLFATATPQVAVAGAPDAPKKGRCEGGNACKGKGACSGAKNSCAGQNGCKGKGWTESTADDCKKAGGKFTPKS
jgi:hypothetical protein